MINAFACAEGRLQRLTVPSEPDALARAAWIDLEEPTSEEAALVHRATGLHVSARDELEEIESSSRLGFEDNALYLSMPMVTHGLDDSPRSSPLGFVVTRDRLITIRFQPSRLFDSFAERVPRESSLKLGALHVFVGLLEALVDRIADVLERIRADLDAISNRTFQESAAPR
ncbi:MAG: CorA family divalent cation transporter, partial [Geminicoccaceae bacterium]